MAQVLKQIKDKKMNFLKEEKIMGKVKIWMVGLALIAMTGLAIAAGPGYGFGMKANCQAGIDRLKLTSEQKTKLGELQEKFRKDTISLRNEMQIRRLEMRTLWITPNPDKDKIMAKQKELNALRDKLQAKSTDFRLDIRKILTPEQAAQIGTLGPGMGFGRSMGRHRMWHHGPYEGPGPGGGPGGTGQGRGPCGGGLGPGGNRL